MKLLCNKSPTCPFNADSEYPCKHCKLHDEFCGCTQRQLCLQTGQESICEEASDASQV